MIIQSSTSPIQAIQPDLVAQGATPVRAVVVSDSQNAPAHISSAELDHAVATINHAMDQANLDLKFSVDADSHQTVVKMMDTRTGELIRQFPTEASIAISREIDQFQQGMLLKQKA